MNIYVGNLDYKIDEQDLRSLFEEFGNVSECRIITDKQNGRSKGFGFVNMDDASNGQKAIEKLNGSEVENREIVVNEAREKKEYNNNKRNY